ncbi:MAG: hypothetical protein CMJ18_01880 [Phycisphaeraceae bacterium]|nr:hypothetical protein [Phycisphaeraceae bacterium]
MARFQYQVRDAHGQSIKGEVAAASLEEAGQVLRAEGKFIITLAPAEEKQAKAKASWGGASTKKVKRADVIFFVQQLTVMLETGVSMSDALECLVEGCDNPAFKKVLEDITHQVQSGSELSVALESHPKVFPELMTALIRASEVSGTMSVMLERIGEYLTKEHKTAKQVKGALMYPLFMMVLAVGVTVFLLAFVLPRFAKIFQQRGATLPAPTRVLLGTSDALVTYWYLWIAGALAIGIGGFIFGRTDTGRRCFDWLKLNAPVIKVLFSKLYLTRACRTMGTMITAGVSILEMIEIVKPVTNNCYYRDLWNDVEDQITQGAQLSQPLFESDLIPRPVSQMILSGEKAGRLGQVMDRVAEFTEAEFDTAVKTTTQFIEPVTIVFMGAVIGFIAISLLMPIFNMGKVMSGG